MNTDRLIELVINQIRKDLEAGDVTAIDELLRYIPAPNLEAYLPEVTIDE